MKPENGGIFDMEEKSARHALKSWLILGFLTIIWGSSYILIKRGLVAFNPFQVAALRVGIASLAFFPFFLLKLKDIQAKDWKYLSVIGLIGTGIPSFLFPLAQTELSSSLAGVLSSLTPLFTLILAGLFFGVQIAKRNALGVFIGLIGAALLIVFGKTAIESGNNWYGLWIVLGCFCYGISSNTLKTFLQDMNPVTISAAAFGLLLPLAVLGFWLTDTASALLSHPEGWTSLAYIALLSLAGTFLASVLFFRLVQMTSAIFAATVAYLMPIVSLLLGAWDGELITHWHFIGMALILVGVYLSRDNS